MSRWFPIAVLAALSLAIACSRAPVPRLLVPANGFEIGAFESRILDISGEDTAQMVINNAAIAFEHISFEVRGTTGSARIEVARLLGGPARKPLDSLGDVFQYVEVAAEAIEDAEIRSVTLSFAVPKRWLNANGHEPDAITLARLSDGWMPLSTWVIGESSSHMRFRAVSPELSLFAIVASRTSAASGPRVTRGFRPLQATRVPIVPPMHGVPSPPTPTTTPVVPTTDPTVRSSSTADATATAGATSGWIPATPPNPTPDSLGPVATPALTARPTTVTPVPLPETTATATPEASATATPDASPEPTGTAGPAPVATASPAPTPTPTPILYDGRYGVVLHRSSLTSDNQYFLEELGVNWYLDFQSDMSQVPNGSNKVAYIRVPTDSTVWTSGDAESIEGLSDTEVAALGFLTRSQIRQMAQDSPGTYWYLFGEPNRYGHITGLRFASVFHYFITELTAGDPTAKIVSPSILNWDFTCVGCTGYQTGEGWLKEFIGAYEAKYGVKPPVDVWAIDVYPIDWTNTPNNDPAKPAFYSAKGDAFPHWSIAVQQLQGLRQYLDSIPDYSNTPIWITEIAIHVAYDGWHFGLSGELVPEGSYHWDKMSDYVIRVLDWLDANAATHEIERWFFFITWTDVVNVSSDGYMGITFFNEPGQGATLNCLGETYRHFALGLNPVKCDATGATVPAGPAGQ